MMPFGARLDLAGEYVRRQSADVIRFAVVLGSGLSEIAEAVEAPIIVPFADIPQFPRTTVAGHRGRLLIGKLQGASVAVFDGRFHCYEGLECRDVALPAYLSKRLGAEYLFVTNAAGGLDRSQRPGDIMIIRDHINLMWVSPLVGEHDESLGSRFQDLTDAYDPRLRAIARRVSLGGDVSIHEGVYAALLGPQYETNAERDMIKRMGAHAVGMSTVPEVIAARQVGLNVLALSVIANTASPSSVAATPVRHQDVLGVVTRAAPAVRTILEEAIRQCPP